MQVFEAVAAQLERERVRAVFGLMGDGNLKLIPRITGATAIPFYGARHEAGAVAMADGHARATGGVGVCTFTQGPGLTNALTALVTARRGRTPLVAISGDTALSVSGLPQDIEQRPIFASCDIPVQEVRPATAHADVAEAFRRARQEQRPIALNLPTDLQEEEAGDHPVAPNTDQPAPIVTVTDLSDALAALRAAQRPVVLAGRGAFFSGVQSELVALADRIGALLATSLPTNNWFAGHPFYLGTAGGFATERTQHLIGEADVVIAFGASVNHFTSRGGQLFARDATLIQVDVDSAAFGRYIPTDLGVVGDAGTVARELTAQLPQAAGYRSEALAAEIAAADAEAPDESDERGIDPRALSRRIGELVPADRTLVVDGGHFMGFPSMDIAVQDPRHFIFTLDFGSIGLGVGGAVGAAVARPDGLTVAAVGDGGLMLSLGELDTAIRYRLPILFVIYNDEAYGAEMHFLQMSGLNDAEARLATPALDEVARAMGMQGLAIGSLEDLDQLTPILDAGLDGPLLLDCRITDRVRAGWLVEAFDRGTH